MSSSGVIDVSAGLIFREGKLLITQRLQGAHLAGLWEFPGGKKEPHESFEECLLRELQEELGIEVQVGELIESITHAYPQKTIHICFYRCALLVGEPRAIDCEAIAWVTQEELSNYEFPAADAHLLGMLSTNTVLWR